VRHVIKRILREEFEWISDSNPDDAIISFIYDRIKDPNYQYMGKWNENGFYHWLDEIGSAIHYLEYDAVEASKYGKKAADDSLSVDDRINNIDSAVDYCSIGMAAEDAKMGLIFFKPFLDEYKVPFNGVLEKAMEYFKNSRPNTNRR